MLLKSGCLRESFTQCMGFRNDLFMKMIVRVLALWKVVSLIVPDSQCISLGGMLIRHTFFFLYREYEVALGFLLWAALDTKRLPWFLGMLSRANLRLNDLHSSSDTYFWAFVIHLWFLNEDYTLVVWLVYTLCSLRRSHLSLKLLSCEFTPSGLVTHIFYEEHLCRLIPWIILLSLHVWKIGLLTSHIRWLLLLQLRRRKTTLKFLTLGVEMTLLFIALMFLTVVLIA